MKATVIYKSNGTVELYGVRRIEVDHESWYVWYGDRNRRNYLHPEIFPKMGGDLLIIQDDDPKSCLLSDPLNIDRPGDDEDASRCEHFKAKILTNGDHIRSMTDKELARWLTGVWYGLEEVPGRCYVCNTKYVQDCCECWMDWLGSLADMEENK